MRTARIIGSSHNLYDVKLFDEGVVGHTDFVFTSDNGIFQALKLYDKARLVVPQPFPDMSRVHVSEYASALKHHGHEDVHKLVDLTLGEVRYHLLAAIKGDIHAFFPHYHSSVSMLLFWLVFQQVRKIVIVDLKLYDENESSELKIYAKKHFAILVQIMEEAGYRIDIIFPNDVSLNHNNEIKKEYVRQQA